MRLVARDEAFVKQLSCEGEEDLSPEGGAIIVNPVNNMVVASSGDYYSYYHNIYGDHRMTSHPLTAHACTAAMRAIEGCRCHRSRSYG